MPGMAFNPSTNTSRRLRNSCTMFATIVDSFIGERFDGRQLAERRCARHAVVHEKIHGGHQVLWHDRISDAPSCHCIGLGEAVDQQQAVRDSGNIQHAGGRRVVIDLGIDFVGKNQQVVLSRKFGNALQIVQRQNAAGRILRAC